MGWWCGVCARVCEVLLAGDGSAKEQPSQFRSRLHNQIQKHPTCNPTCKYHGFLSIDSSLNICFEERISPQMQSGQDFNNPFTNHPHYPPHTHRGGAGGPPNSTHPPTPTGGGTLPLGVGGPPRTWLIYARMHFALTPAGPEQQAEATVEVPGRCEGPHVRCRHSNW